MKRTVLYSHVANHGATWKVDVARYDGHTISASVCSDGSVRLAIVGIRALAKVGPYDMGTLGMRQLFRLVNIGSQIDLHGVGPVADVEVQLATEETGNQRDNDANELSDPRVAMHAVHIHSYAREAGTGGLREGPTVDLHYVAVYGGAAGLLRVQSLYPAECCN